MRKLLVRLNAALRDALDSDEVPKSAVRAAACGIDHGRLWRHRAPAVKGGAAAAQPFP